MTPDELVAQEAAALIRGRWLTPAESGVRCRFPIGSASGGLCLRCEVDHAAPIRAGPPRASPKP